MKKTSIIMVAILLAFTISAMGVQASDLVEISLKDYQQALQQRGFEARDSIDIVGIDRDTHLVKVLINETGKKILDEDRISWNIIKTQREMRDNRDIDPQYYNYAEVTTTLANIQSTYPSIAQRYDLGTTSENRKIWALKISDNVFVQEDEPEILVIGLHEAREIMST
ncbi:hypothetical protein K8T06_17655, partial [bacterium]|nr:hypothetical protein [bacterium]